MIEQIQVKSERKSYQALPHHISPVEVPAYMELNGIERGFQKGVAVPVSQIRFDYDVVDQDHMVGVRKYDLDNQVEEISLVAMYDIYGELYYEVTNGHHRVAARMEQALERGEPDLPINSYVRYGANQAEVFEMRLEDLNSKLNGVMFLRISRWLTSAFTLREWSTDVLMHAIDTGQLSTSQAIDFAAREHARTSFKVTLPDERVVTLSPVEKNEIVSWIKEITRNFEIGLPQLRSYIEVATIAPEELIKRVQIRSGGGHEGSGKITFDLLKCLTNVFGSDYPRMQIAIANACVKHNVPAQLLKNNTVLNDLKQRFLRANMRIDEEHISNELLRQKKRPHVPNGNNHPLPADRVIYANGDHEYPKPEYRNGKSTNDQVISVLQQAHEANLAKFWEERLREYETDSLQADFTFTLKDGAMAFFDARTGILISEKDEASMVLSIHERALFAAIIQWRTEGYEPIPEDYKHALFGTELDVPESVVRMQAGIVKRAVRAKYLKFLRDYDQAKSH